MNEYIIPGLSLGIIVSIVFALHGIVQQQIKNLQERLDQEAIRLKENTEKSERRLDDLNRLAEQRLKDETSKAELRVEVSLKVAEDHRKEQARATVEMLDLKILNLEDKIKK